MPFTVQQLIENNKPVIVYDNDPVKKAQSLMVEHRFSQLPVINEQERVLGLITSDSILRALNTFGVYIEKLRVLVAMDNAYFMTPSGQMDIAARDKAVEEIDPTKPFDKLVQSQYITMFLQPSRWPRYSSIFSFDRQTVLDLLNEARKTRNAAAHFHNEEITPDQRKRLKFCRDWLARHAFAILKEFHPVTDEAILKQFTVPLQVTYTISSGDEIMPIEEVLSPHDSRYAPLALLLQEQPIEHNQIQLTFKQIEEIIGDELPASARQHRSWWANDSVGHVQSQQWLEVGWRVSFVDMENETVLFIRGKERSKLYSYFFNLFYNELSQVAQFTLKSYSASDRNWITIAQVPKTASFGLCFARHGRFRVELYIDTGDKEMNKRIFDALYERRDEIHSELEGVPGSLEWERIDNKRASRIAIYHKGAITDSDDELESLREWAADAMVRFQKVMGEHLSEVL